MNDLMTKSFTNYVDLKKAAMKDADLEAGNLEMASSKAHMDSDLGLFLEEAEKVKTEMSELRNILSSLQQANEEFKSLHKPEALKSLRSKINDNILTVLKKARTIRSQLEQMDQAQRAYDGLPGLRQRMMTEYKETVGRRYFTVTGENPDEEVIDKIISNGGEEFLGRAVQEHGRGKVLETVVEIQDRHDAAKEIEKSLLELHQVFLDMAVMVEAQGEQMDNIEQHVLNASHYVKDATKELQTANKYKRNSRKWMCVAVILLLVIILVVVIPIVTSFANS
ncbi:syntaxin-related protein knolle [Quercus suber]|uniref:Syntaxin-related protein knolle n=1 Tax=Quercus suber TaxID=58331 RepID=A0AAW0IYF0_QUESU